MASASSGAKEAAEKLRKADSSPAEARFGMTGIKGLMAPFGSAQGRLEVVPFPKYAVARVLQQPVKPSLYGLSAAPLKPCPSRKPFYETSTKQWLKLHTPLGRFVRTDRLRLGQKLLPA
jgi:hypothetical protein